MVVSGSLNRWNRWYFFSPVWRVLCHSYTVTYILPIGWWLAGVVFWFPKNGDTIQGTKKHHSGNKKPGALFRKVCFCRRLPVYSLGICLPLYLQMLAPEKWKSQNEKYRLTTITFQGRAVKLQGRGTVVGVRYIQFSPDLCSKIPWTWLTLFCVNSFVGSLQGGPVRSL